MSCTKEEIVQNIQKIKKQIYNAQISAGRPQDSVRLLAATKTVSAQNINFALDNGIDLIGENKVQELLEKYDDIDKTKCEIHFIGSLQTNKVKYIIDKVSLIHSVDSVKLAKEISKRAQAKGITMDILIEVNVGCEASKSGVLPGDCVALVEQICSLPAIRIKGLMAIPPSVQNLQVCFDNDDECHNNEKNNMLTKYFQKIQQLIIDISQKKLDNVYMDILSFGMSGDFECAIAHGSTMVRIGSGIFGKRDYSAKKL